MTKIRILLSAFFCTAILLVFGVGGTARAAYPDHVVNAVVPFDVGGASDILARVLSNGLTKELGQNFLVVNKAGGGGNLGMNYVAHSKPDGYTLLFTAPASTQNPSMFKNMPYDPMKDLVPIAEDGESLFMIAVNTAKIQAKTLSEFVDLVKENPGKFNAGAGGLVSRLTVEFFRLKNDLNVVIVPYNSAGEAATALLTGEVDFMVVDAGPLVPGIESGKIRGLAVTGPHRLEVFPNIPTVEEAGLQDYEDYTYHGLYGPGGMARDQIAKLHDAINRITQQPEVIAQYKKLGWTTVQKTQKEFDSFYREEIVKWKGVVAKAKIPPVD